ncbi:MAG: DUF1570 domain-containing protein [Tepidisphaeraceae bacterium]
MGMLLSCLAARARAQEDLAKSLGEGFAVYRSEHFSLVSNALPTAGRAQLAVLEDTWETFFRETARIGLEPKKPEQRLACVLFEKRSQFLDYLKSIGETEADWTAGTFLAQRGQTVFFNDSDNPAFAETLQELARLDAELAEARAQFEKTPRTEVARLIPLQEKIKRLANQRAELHRRFVAVASASTLGKSRHETAHQLFFTSGLQTPSRQYPWFLTEGLACLFETADKTGQSGPGLPNEWRLMSYRRAEQANGLMAVKDLLSYTPGDQEDERTVAWRYAQAWVLMHYLWNGRATDLRLLLADVNGDADPKAWPAIFEKRLGSDLAELDRRVREHVEGMASTDEPRGR